MNTALNSLHVYLVILSGSSPPEKIIATGSQQSFLFSISWMCFPMSPQGTCYAPLVD